MNVVFNSFTWLYGRSWASLVAQMVKNLPGMQKTWIQSLGQKDLLKKGMATHSSILAWRIPWTEEPGRLQSSGCNKLDMTEQLTLTRWLMLGVCLVCKKPPNYLPKGLDHLAFPLAMSKCSCCSTSSEAFVIVSVLDSSYFNRCVGIFHC